ncbi:MAG: hypothetical protein IKJ68_10245 [Clostridia bacterium]|nr:hypothetical protein [Clostridia bacterium]
MVCKTCNNQISNNSKLCKYCGTVITEHLNHTPDTTYSYNYVHQKRNSSNLIIIITVCICMITLLSAFAAIFMIKAKNSTDSQPETYVKKYEINTVSSGEENDTEPTREFNRIKTYSPNYVYKSMPDIYSTIAATDAECFEMENYITHYNKLWLNLVNYKDDSILSYVRYGTPPYNDVISYKSKNISEKFEIFDVNDVRKHGDTYYIWVHEKIIEYYPNETKTKEYHWIYKVSKDNNGYYVENYSRDPHYS